MLGKHHYFNKESYLKKCNADAFCPQEMDTFCRCGLLCSLGVSGLRPRNDSRACGRRGARGDPCFDRAVPWLPWQWGTFPSPPYSLQAFSSSVLNSLPAPLSVGTVSLNTMLCSGTLWMTPWRVVPCCWISSSVPHPCPSLCDSAPRLPQGLKRSFFFFFFNSLIWTYLAHLNTDLSFLLRILWQIPRNAHLWLCGEMTGMVSERGFTTWGRL